jgi:nucleotide-binding universal stress UspA family protein
MYSRILVPIDGSDISDHCLTQAIKFAKEQKAKLRAVFVVDTMVMDCFNSKHALDNYIDNIRENGNQLLGNAKERASKAGVPITTRLIEIAILGDKIAQMIVKEANEWPADAIMIGTHGRRGINHFLLGSVAEGVSRLARCPVLLIHASQAAGLKKTRRISTRK